MRRVAALYLLAVCLLPAAADYAGAEACRACHPAEYAGQSLSEHAHALAHSQPSQAGDWAFGAGMQAITFVSRVDRESYRELGETWYRSLNGYGLTPGHHRPGGVLFRIFDPAARVLRCFACHSTGVLALGHDDEIVPHELGVRCEVCHGPASAHALRPAANRLRTPASLSASEMNTFCGKCHRLDLVSGEELTDLRNPWILRNPPRLLAASACFQKSRGRLNCLSCHAPHAPLEQSAAAYDRICQGCHTAPEHRQSIAGQPCVTCHMPPARMDNLVFTNHRIAAYSTQNPLVPVNVPRRP